MKSKLKVMTVLGTRPEIIRLSRVMALLDKSVDQLIVHTGQNYDYELNEIFFRDLKIRKPDHFLGVNTSTLGNVYGGILIKIEKLLAKKRPDAVLILGDTNSSIAAVMARRMKIPVYHMEAGNRCFDLNVPEEINRRMIDHVSDFNLVYTEHARRNLLLEGLHPRRIYLTGSPMREVLDAYLPQIEASDIMERLDLKRGQYFLASIHREENVERKINLMSLLESLDVLCGEYGLPMIVSTHPRTRKSLEKLNQSKKHKKISFLKPFGYLDYVKLQKNAFCVISDSGTICEESAMLSFPAVTVRNAMERPEAMDAGNIVLTGLMPGTIRDAVDFVTVNRKAMDNRRIPAEYKIDNTSYRVVKLILGTARLSHLWDGIVE